MMTSDAFHYPSEEGFVISVDRESAKWQFELSLLLIGAVAIACIVISVFFASEFRRGVAIQPTGAATQAFVQPGAAALPRN